MTGRCLWWQVATGKGLAAADWPVCTEFATTEKPDLAGCAVKPGFEAARPRISIPEEFRANMSGWWCLREQRN